MKTRSCHPLRQFVSSVRIGALTALLGVVGVGLNGCTGNAAPSDVVELTFAHPISAINDPIFQEALDEFMRQHPKVRVRRMAVAGDYYSKLMVMIAGNTAPDVMWMGQSFGEFAQRNAFLDISAMTRDLNPQDYYATVIDWYRQDGKLLGFPFGVDCTVVAYNKKLFKQAGEPFPKSNWKIPQFLATCQRLMKSPAGKNPNFHAFGGEGVHRGAFGAQILSDDKSHAVLNSPAAIEAAQFNADLRNRYRITPDISQGALNRSENAQEFKLGHLAMVSCSTWDIAPFAKEVKSFDWDVVLPPSGRSRAVWGSSGGITVYARTPHPREATLLLKQMVAPDFQLKICLASGSYPSHRATAATWVRKMPRPPQHVQVFLDSAPDLKPAPRVVALSEIMDKVNRAEDRIALKRASVQQAMQDATKQIDGIIARQNRLLARRAQ